MCCWAAHGQVFDAVLVCNGHYSEPNLPVVAGSDCWPGLQMHSHNYRVPEVFTGQTVVVVGASNSGKELPSDVGAERKQHSDGNELVSQAGD